MRLISSRMILLLTVVLALTFPLLASDHVDSPNNAEDRGTDLADGYMFLDPNDNTRVVVVMTWSGFIVPGENQNLGVFSEDGSARFTFDFENTGDAVPDKSIRVTFGPKTSGAAQQDALIELFDGRVFTAKTTGASHVAATAPDPVITEDPTTGIRYFCGIADDPFFFDIPAFGRFTTSVRAGTPDVTTLSRGRDSFAGYNVLSMAFSIPVGLLRGTNGNTVGVSMTAQRRIAQFINADGRVSGSGAYVNADRQGLPGINTVLVPFLRKKEYNRSRPQDDAAGKFANDIVATLKALGTSDANVATLAALAVTKGDILRLDTGVANTGTNAQGGFPNGRRLQDDVIDTILTVVAGGTLGDSVPANDVAFRTTFPFLAPPHQPLAAGATDNTKN